MEKEPAKNTRIHRLHRKLRDDLKKSEERREKAHSWTVKREYDGIIAGIHLALRRIEDMWDDEDFRI